jgi:hypothetical protein
MSMAEIFPEIFYPEGGKGFFRPPVVQVEYDASQIEDDVFDALHAQK